MPANAERGMPSASTGSIAVAGGRARPAVDRRDLSEELAGAAEAEDRVAPAAGRDGDLHPAGDEHDHRAAVVAAVEEHGVPGVAAPRRGRLQRGTGGRLDGGEEVQRLCHERTLPRNSLRARARVL
jgi:hypothetical protein